MKKVCRTLVLVVFAGSILGGMVRAQERGRGGTMRGTFVRLEEREVGERAYMGIVIKPFERDDHVIVLVPPRPGELGEAARRLREGQRVEISFVSEAGHMWLKGMETERREVVEERPEGRRAVNVRREVLRWREGERDRPGAERPLANLRQMERELREVLGAHFEGKENFESFWGACSVWKESCKSFVRRTSD